MSAWIETYSIIPANNLAYSRTLMSAWIETVQPGDKRPCPASHSHECVD